MDTIAAIATALGKSGIGIVRMSGDAALKIADKIFVSSQGGRPSRFETHTLHYGWIVDKDQRAEDRKQKREKNLPSGNIIDEVLLAVMRKPRSYTREDVVEINCHGGIVALRKVLQLVLRCGARLAEPGEFTQRAFVSGRIDLIQAEAVLDVIQAKNDAALRLAGRQLGGGISREIGRIRERVLSALAEMEAAINFPDEDTGKVGRRRITDCLSFCLVRAENLLSSAALGRVVREGVSLAICGRPNVGKSSLLNALLKQERAIVTSCPGTTRDIIEETLDIRGLPVTIADTAGISAAKDDAGARAVERAHKYISGCDLVLFVLDASRKLSRGDISLIKQIDGRPKIAALNKTDLLRKISRQDIRPYFRRITEVSALKHQGIEKLEREISRVVLDGKVLDGGQAMLTNIRHKQALEKGAGFVREALAALKEGFSEDLISQSLREAISCLDEITGKNMNVDLLDDIFSRFCIGK
ncbi:MAG: tRNA uridine-5-carboxymethylaminomethyl(34) synthesis GTPase MnmE [Candidatus Omnitrophota bacterium]